MASVLTAARFRYWSLTVLLVAALSFQVATWVETFSGPFSKPDPLASLLSATWVINFILRVLSPLAALVLGFYVAFVRIQDHRAWLMLAVLITFSLNLYGADTPDRVMNWNGPFKHVALVYHIAGMRSWPIWLMVFAIYFPEKAQFESRRPALKWMLLIPLSITWLFGVTVRIARNEGLQLSATVPSLPRAGYFAITFLYWFCISAFLIILFVKLLRETAPDARRRLRVLFAGLAVSLLPPLLLDTIAYDVLAMRDDAIPAWIRVLVYAALAFFPVTLAYVTVVQRALDVRVILRQSLQYALARRGLVVLQGAISLIVIFCVALFSGQASLPARMAMTAIGVGAVLSVGLGTRKLAAWIDRKFFRDAYRTELVLTRLADSVRSIVELKPLLEMVVGRISEALHVARVAVFLREGNDYKAAWAIGYSKSPQASFDKREALAKLLRRNEKALPVYLENPHSWIMRLGVGEVTGLRELASQLLVPLCRRDELLGFISLGQKASETPYSSTDLDLLQSVASQTALAVENSRLTNTVAAEIAEREILLRELAIARDVQQRLFPQVYPEIHGVDYDATCRPAQEVGGDYYDFIELPDRSLGIAIGDISGKGVPAALLMASLQATLRGQTASGKFDVSQLLNNINRAIYAASPSNRYATFFYGHYQPDLQSLTYINAGHNAPILLHSGHNGKVVRLGAAGPPVGLFPKCDYESTEVNLKEGGLLILYTDGISEAMNADDQEWGEERLIEVGRRMSEASPAKLLKSIFEAADAFAANSPQHDDMTLMVFRFRAEGREVSNVVTPPSRSGFCDGPV